MLTRTVRACYAKTRSTASTSIRTPKFRNAYKVRNATTAIIPPSVEDTALIPFFDQPSAYRTQSARHSGIFLHAKLTSPHSITLLAEGTLRRANILTERILGAQSREELRLVLKNLDKLSDILCGVIDLTELIRNSHPDYMWIKNANEAYDMLCEFMNQLNTHVGLYNVLERVLSDDEIVRSLSQEAYSTAMIFWKDFEKSAINLPIEQRRRFVALSSEILTLGRKFLDEAASPRPPALIAPSELKGLKDNRMGARLSLQAYVTNKPLLVYPGSLQAHMIMRSAPEEEPRRKLYVAANSSTPEQLETLERLLRARAELARLCGKESFAHLALGDKMAKSPENVSYFLSALLEHTRPYARDALLALSQRKRLHLNLPSLPIIQAWDRDYYCPPEAPAPPIPLPPLTPGTVFMALSRLFRHLYGVTLRLTETALGEVWHRDVRKLEVVDEDAGVIGWIYADLFARKGKASGAAHYTVRCSRRTDDDDPAADFIPAEQMDETVQLSLDFDRNHRRRLKGVQGEYQLPVVVLLCEFMPPSASRGASPLQWHEVQTLFHEMGHAMHSMIGRTEYHNVSGTRCATDFVELPSILMEHFLQSPTVLGLFDPNFNLASAARSANHHRDPCHSIDTHTQILLAVLDQEYHSTLPLHPTFDSTTVYNRLLESRGLIPPVQGTSWQTQFGHLYGYGATYYSYLLDRAFASRVWSQVFASDPLNRMTGERYKNEVLKVGGGKDPWQMISGLLGSPQLEVGDAESMREVGRWKIEDDIASRH